MTRKFWYILVGGILFAIGCSKSPEQSEETIRELNFSSQITDSADSATTNAPESRGTGGTLVTNGGLKNEGNAFVVYSTYSLGGLSSQTFDNQPQTVTYTSGAWTYSEKKIWVNSAKYKFRAYYPAVAEILSSSSNPDLLTLEYNIARDNFDLMVAYAERQPSVDPEGYGVVTMPFKHALSALRFEIKYDPLSIAPGTTDKITKAYLQNLCVVGLLTFNGSPSNYQMNWSKSYSDAEQRYLWEGSKIFGVGDANKISVYDNDNIVFAIPQEITAKITAFHFFTESGLDNHHIAYIPAITWEPGKVYTYTITLSGSSISVAVSIKEWQNISSNVDIQV